jgi:hypothetical protein
MKKILYSILIATLALTFGCEEPDEVKYTVADGFGARQSPFTVLDQEVTVNFSTANPDVSQLTIEHVQTINVSTEDTVEAQGELNTVSISDGSGSITFTRSDLKINDNAGPGSIVLFQSTADIKGNPVNSFSVAISEPMSLMGPYIWSTDEDGNDITKDVSVYHNDDIQYIKYNLVRNGSSISGMTLEEKIGVNGTYSEVTGTDFNLEANDAGAIIDSIEVVGTDYTYGDTVYYRFTASSNFSSYSSEISVPINKLTFGESGTFKLDSTSNKAWDMVNNKMILDTANYDSADVALTYTAPDMGLTSSDSTSFIDATGNIADPANKEVVVEYYKNNSGSETNDVSALEVGDIILTKTQRYGEEHYGILIVEEAWVNTTQDNYYLTLSYKNN